MKLPTPAVPMRQLCRNKLSAVWQQKTAVSSAIDKNGARIRCLIFLGALPSLDFGDFPARCLAELRHCFFLRRDDASAKGGLDQPGELAIEPFRFHRLEFLLLGGVVIQLSCSASDSTITQP